MPKLVRINNPTKKTFCCFFSTDHPKCRHKILDISPETTVDVPEQIWEEAKILFTEAEVDISELKVTKQ